MSGVRHIDLRSKREVLGLIEHLVQQGARVEWAPHHDFPAKVYPPDPTKHFILFHGSVSDTNAHTMKRNEIRRAGLRWPGDPISRKETTMSAVQETPALADERKPGEHLVMPAGAKNAKVPTPSSLATVQPVLDGMPKTFWTDQALEAVRALGVPGYNATSGMQRLQGVLHQRGFRVVEAKRNRNGFSYRWEFDPAAPLVEPVDPIERLRAAAESPAEPDAERLIEKLERDTGITTPLPAEAGPVAAAFADAAKRKAEEAPAGFEVFQKPRAGETLRDRMTRQTRHDRVMCDECERWFTPDGLERHQEILGHAQKSEVVKAEEAASSAADEKVDVEGILALRGGPVDLEQALAEEAPATEENEVVEDAVPLQVTASEPTVPKADYDTMEALARENEEKLADAVREQALLDAEIERKNRAIVELDQEIARLKEAAAIRDGQVQQEILQAEERVRVALREEIDEAHRNSQAAIEQRGTIFRELETEREQHAQTKRALEAAIEVEAQTSAALEDATARIGRGDDGSWLIPWEQVGNEWTSTIVSNAAKLGVTLELRGRVGA